jgi:hypothetical protein
MLSEYQSDWTVERQDSDAQGEIFLKMSGRSPIGRGWLDG